MKSIDFWFDPISPYAYLAFEHLPLALQGLSYSVSYRPVLFASLLKHHGQLGPAEIAPKREWTYRHIQWQARQLAIALDMPQSHPFNPLPLLRLALAYGNGSGCNRYVTECVLYHVWRSGHKAQDAQDSERLPALQAALGAERERWQGVATPDANSQAVKDQLKANSDEAIRIGLFGVPSMVVGGQVFWGVEGLPMLRAYLEGDTWFQNPAWKAAAQLPVGLARPTK
jgi:2-hydroxychromene-2-carboxylate isomerase